MSKHQLEDDVRKRTTNINIVDFNILGKGIYVNTSLLLISRLR